MTGGEPRGPEGLSPDLGSGCFLFILFLLFWAFEKINSYGGFVPSPMSLLYASGEGDDLRNLEPSPLPLFTSGGTISHGSRAI